MLPRRQLDLYAGQQAKAEGLRRIEAHHPDFLAEVRAFARQVSARRGWVSIDDLRVEARARGLAPRHPNAWGAVFKESGWQQVGRRASAFPSNHAREVRTWKWTG